MNLQRVLLTESNDSVFFCLIAFINYHWLTINMIQTYWGSIYVDIITRKCGV
jgi:hypothetical protein